MFNFIERFRARHNTLSYSAMSSQMQKLSKDLTSISDRLYRVTCRMQELEKTVTQATYPKITPGQYCDVLHMSALARQLRLEPKELYAYYRQAQPEVVPDIESYKLNKQHL